MRCDLEPAPKRSLLCQLPLINTPPSRGSLGDNQLCGVNKWGVGTYTTEGITKLCEALKGSAVTSLECAPPPRVFAFVSAPVDTLALSHHLRSAPRRLGWNDIGEKGASVLAAILKETKITDLKCAAAPECSLSCQHR